ncbi:two-component system, OmpR family, phosphate regulon sensor histidine kinase PhoR [Lentibacillus halodurans]|uniref:histidine kinase n=1 Tax=Lentibacillus halodurans TaxID=237679 RepID=A0A1I0ZI09_9BACI|nr:HAMP domain-containing sensor histidine kinase [Lentibacillus halodurans]SFB24766.1 two-component system, OmpR family, phosphate regulon sensor histidine kinase PhoR [Lentibacillus halodurans]
MKPLFTKPLLAYHAILLLLVAVTGIALSQLTTEYIILVSILIVEYFILLVIMLHVYDRYMKPVKKASQTVDELVKGNYRTRIHHSAGGSIGELNNKLNVLARNLSEFKIQEQVQEEQLTTVIDNTQSGLVLIDEKGYIHLVNRKFLAMFGGESNDYHGYIYYDVLANETIHETVQQTFLYEKNIIHSFKQFIGVNKKYIEIIGAPIFNERGMLKGAVLLLYDITHLKRLELMRKDFVANVSHELKTPITSIKGFAETLLNGAKNDQESLDRFLTIINDESTRLQGLIEDLLTLSKLEKDEFKLIRTVVDMNLLIGEILPVIDQRANQREITVTADVQDGITLHADGERIKQVIINLLTNAISYTPENGEVNLTVNNEGEMIHIQVSDNGIGIPEKAIPRIFERFYRVDKARSRNTGGTGLGLAIVKHIVEVHDGKISVESEPDQGSTFHVYLPKNDPASS